VSGVSISVWPKEVFDTLTVTENLEMGGYLLTKPQLAALVLDEPASNLSPELSRSVFRGREP
jgi:ABC-type branched-subunit amino acid transport system ATPase component